MDHFESFQISAGDRVEYVLALAVLLACDDARQTAKGPPNKNLDLDGLKRVAIYTKTLATSRHFKTSSKTVVFGSTILCVLTTTTICSHCIIPVLKGDILRKESMSAILSQVKNDKVFTATRCDWLYDAMDPFHIGLVGPQDNAPSLIRLVLRLLHRLQP